MDEKLGKFIFWFCFIFGTWFGFGITPILALLILLKLVSFAGWNDGIIYIATLATGWNFLLVPLIWLAVFDLRLSKLPIALLWPHAMVTASIASLVKDWKFQRNYNKANPK